MGVHHRLCELLPLWARMNMNTQDSRIRTLITSPKNSGRVLQLKWRSRCWGKCEDQKKSFGVCDTPWVLGEAKSELELDFSGLDVCLFKGESSQVSTFPPRNLHKENGLASVCLSWGWGKNCLSVSLNSCTELLRRSVCFPWKGRATHSPEMFDLFPLLLPQDKQMVW